MKLHSAKPERDKLLEIPLEILAVRMERAEADEFSADFSTSPAMYRFIERTCFAVTATD